MKKTTRISRDFFAIRFGLTFSKESKQREATSEGFSKLVVSCLCSATSNGAIHRKYGLQMKSCHLRTFELQDATHTHTHINTLALNYTLPQIKTNKEMKLRKKAQEDEAKEEKLTPKQTALSNFSRQSENVASTLFFSVIRFKRRDNFGVEMKKKTSGSHLS